MENKERLQQSIEQVNLIKEKLLSKTLGGGATEDRIDLGNFIGTVGGLWRVNLVQADGSSLFTGYYIDFSKGNIDDVENAPDINASGILKPINCVLSASAEKVKTYLEGEYVLASVESEGQKQYIVEIITDWATNFWGEEINMLLYDPVTNTLSNAKGTYFLTKMNTPRLQDKTVTENGDVKVDAGLFDGLGVVTVNVASSGGGQDANVMSASDFMFNNYEDKNCCTGYAGSNNMIVIPYSYSLDNGEPIDGSDYKVTKLDGRIFDSEGNAIGTSFKVPTILIPKYIKEIDSYCFKEPETSFNITRIDILGDTISVGNGAFYNCRNLVTLNTSKIRLLTGSNPEQMFYECRKLGSIDVSNLDISDATSMKSMFYGVGYDTAGMTFTGLENLNTGNIVDMSHLFRGCKWKSLGDISNWDTSKVENMYCMFYDTKYRQAGLLYTLDISNWDTKNVKKMGWMFAEGSVSCLKEIKGTLDMSSVTDAVNMFRSCTALTTVHLTNIGTPLSLDYSTSLTLNVLISIIKELINKNQLLTLTLGNSNRLKLANTYVKLIEDDGSGKLPFELCESTDEGAMLITDYVTLKNWAIA